MRVQRILTYSVLAALFPALSGIATPALAAKVYDEQGVQDRTLRVAAREGDIERIREALEHGARIDGRSERGITAVMNAARNCRVEALRLLITRSANLEMQDNRGRTALMFAAGNSCLPAVQVLLGKKVNLKLKDNVGRAALDYAVSAATLDYDGDASECVRLLGGKRAKPRSVGH